MGKLIKELSQLNIKLNITAVYNSNQTKKNFTMFEKKFNSDHFDFRRKSSRCRKRSYTRVEKSFKMSKKYKNVKILWASVREPYNYLQAKQLGCHLITIPPINN